MNASAFERQGTEKRSEFSEALRSTDTLRSTEAHLGCEAEQRLRNTLLRAPIHHWGDGREPNNDARNEKEAATFTSSRFINL